MLKGKKILLGITGGIAAYKAVELAGKLTKKGAVVKTVMTKNACEFVSPLTFKSITHQPVITKFFDPEAEIEHISLADWADIIVIAPATANIMGKVASGIADDLLSTTIMAAKAPVLFVPSMNVHMYENPIVQENISKLSKLGYFFMEPEIGQLACGYEGMGRFPKTDEILYYIKSYLNYKKDLKNKSILVTTGSCREKIDPMRFISNYSTGKMGLSLARAAFIRGANVKMIYGIVSEQIPEYLETITTSNAEEMYKATIKEFSNNQVIIMTAAVADYTPAKPSKLKIKKTEDMVLKLKRTKDILFELGKRKSKDQVLVGFAAESEKIVENARKKLKKKNLDFIAANNLEVAGKEETEIVFIGKELEEKITGDKFFVAHRILDLILNK